MTPEVAQAAVDLVAKISRLQSVVNNLSSALVAGAVIARVELTGSGDGLIYNGLNEVISPTESQDLLNTALAVLNSKLLSAQASLSAL